MLSICTYWRSCLGGASLWAGRWRGGDYFPPTNFTNPLAESAVSWRALTQPLESGQALESHRQRNLARAQNPIKVGRAGWRASVECQDAWTRWSLVAMFFHRRASHPLPSHVFAPRRAWVGLGACGCTKLTTLYGPARLLEPFALHTSWKKSCGRVSPWPNVSP